jgi:uncharacterized metal-binding protein YceD (DUF177 family)
MTNPLFDRATPLGLARAGQVIECTAKLQDFVRLVAAVEAELAGIADPDRPAAWRQVPVSIRLRFGFADAADRVPVVVGEASTAVAAVCQRCLECFELPLEADFSYVLQALDESAPELTGYEAWELGESAVRPADLVDEALLMAWPLAAAHASPTECGPLARRLATETEDKVHPFADLKAKLERANKE